MKIAVCIPFYKFMEAKAVESLVVMMADIHSRGDIYVPIVCHSLYIERARTALTKAVVKQAPDADFVLWIDTDHVYSSKALYSLIETMKREKLDMLSAAYTARNMPEFYAHCRYDGGTPMKIKKNGHKGLMECDVVGLGFSVFRPAFLRRMLEKHGEALFGNRSEDGVLKTGDDRTFCDLARKAGQRVYFDADVQVGHISSVVL